MKLKEYKRLPAFAIAAALALLAGGAGAAAPETQPDLQLARSSLAQVESLAKTSRSLDQLGKDTLTQAATFLDLGKTGLPVLTPAVNDRRKDWRVRFWAADLLGYVGVEASVPYLMKAAANEKERKEVRLRALDSILGICERENLRIGPVRSGLKRMRRGTRNAEVRKKISSVLLKLKKPS
jgi:hypothetical protein